VFAQIPGETRIAQIWRREWKGWGIIMNYHIIRLKRELICKSAARRHAD
jgi:hypothetical protein